MLLNYLYSNFMEEGAFAKSNGTSLQGLQALITARVFPSPSYIFESNGQSASFVSDFTERATYRFHLCGHSAWLEAITRLGLTTESRAHTYFYARYSSAREAFFASDLGQELIETAPDVPRQFDADHAKATWEHFLNGVYGVCTRDGQPETVFLKQVGVVFIERMIVDGPGSLSDAQLALLARSVGFLDEVESDFAPHEAPLASRQRCIVDVSAKFFIGVVA